MLNLNHEADLGIGSEIRISEQEGSIPSRGAILKYQTEPKPRISLKYNTNGV